MHYHSTRSAPSSQFAASQGAPATFTDVLLGGLAPDGGLYVPSQWPKLDKETLRAWRKLDYPALAARTISLFAGEDIPLPTLEAMTKRAYSRFGHSAIVPLVEVSPGLYALELFHGPTLAFKDMAMQMLGELFEEALKRRNAHVTIVGATSGDTGSAALEAFKGKENVNIVILHPLGRTSEVQRRQMTSVQAPNVLNIAIEGDFDDCQAMVKAMFADSAFREEVHLSAVNSINWARIAAQVAYFIHAALKLGAPDRPVSFAVPTGNFGNVLAAWGAKQMGVPVSRLCVGSNQNDILTRFLHNNDMSRSPVAPSLSPSMDIQVSSNFERLLHESLGRDGEACKATMESFAQTGAMAVPEQAWQRITAHFMGRSLDDGATLNAMKRFADGGYVADPHTAIGLVAGEGGLEPGVPMIVAATAHPAKFPDAVHKATGQRPAQPAQLEGLWQRPERCLTLPADLAKVKQAVATFSRRDS
ncbi:threonine synthase [Formicincola oecophyllae]|uniref:Threonine synthase n=1 Tax=Formicincola oecophyllae TaxID=2558361 RepID=A0A4Y6UBH0_9PROT|nr:threonine synthase [Formicincola oecophyllae]QDH13918.1 threonine synthase [Formicincola oecophyllae]